ncbi:hypothetical protein EO98_15350 [Methanosarcina sp. 2.H.T.1A.6]|nr:hypothetical protein EO94_06705 [Methanosarcina sp. 2.H.T.1A.3]KKG22568.1 hypothetical protein EO97_04620 [Methanosarcina sp. 2.H.T.1A.15]KKG22881.1 hypothetical protein EO98_15350 [Methanosarcina sp. 2.H.T.1A.6]KKG24389.1 hypothetical protein EO96_14515 [Methanosarcina sp. 2.H.T.1A.8]
MYQKIEIEREIKIYKEIIAKFKELLSKWKEFRSVRSIIEDIFKLAKKASSMEDLHRYTRISVQKYCSLAVLLVEIEKLKVLRIGIRLDSIFQSMTETQMLQSISKNSLFKIKI